MIAKSILLLMFVIFSSIGVNRSAPAACKIVRDAIDATKPVPSESVQIDGDDELTDELENAGNRLIMIEFPQHGYYPSLGGDTYSGLEGVQYRKLMRQFPGLLIIKVNSNNCKKALAARGIEQLSTFSFRKGKSEKQENQVYVLSHLTMNSTTDRLIEALKNA